MAPRMVIQARPLAELEDDGLPPLGAMPPADGTLSIKFMRQRMSINGWGEETVRAFARDFGRQVMAIERERAASQLAEMRELLKEALCEMVDRAAVMKKAMDSLNQTKGDSHDPQPHP
jgi:hypothetical protein